MRPVRSRPAAASQRRRDGGPPFETARGGNTGAVKAGPPVGAGELACRLYQWATSSGTGALESSSSVTLPRTHSRKREWP